MWDYLSSLKGLNPCSLQWEYGGVLTTGQPGKYRMDTDFSLERTQIKISFLSMEGFNHFLLPGDFFVVVFKCNTYSNFHLSQHIQYLARGPIY